MTIEVAGRPSKPFKINIYERFYNAIANASPFRDDGKLHVSELTHPCMRHAYYDRISVDHSHNIKTMLTFWIGHKLHETPVFEHHEQGLEWEGIIGSCDEYENGNLLEKKTCTKLPDNPYEEHVLQSEYYAFLLHKVGKPVNFIHILYIDIMSKEISPFTIRFRPFAKIEAELVHKRDTLRKAIDTGTLPSRYLSKKCEFCTHASKCFSLEN